MEVILDLVTPIGTALYLDLGSIQKTSGSITKVKVQIDIIKERQQHVWLEFDENDIFVGKWQLIQYEDISEYCIH